MATLRRTVKKTLIETDTTAKVLEALTDHDPKDIVAYMAKHTPRTLVDIIKRMKGEVAVMETVDSPGPLKGRTDWDEIKVSLETMYETGEYTMEDLVDACVELCEGEVDRYTAKMLVGEIFDE